MQLAQIKEELNNTSSNNAYPRFPCNYSFLAANSFYIIPPKPQATSPNNYDFASDPADATGDPVNSSDPSGMMTPTLPSIDLLSSVLNETPGQVRSDLAGYPVYSHESIGADSAFFQPDQGGLWQSHNAGSDLTWSVNVYSPIVYLWNKTGGMLNGSTDPYSNVALVIIFTDLYSGNQDSPDHASRKRPPLSYGEFLAYLFPEASIFNSGVGEGIKPFGLISTRDNSVDWWISNEYNGHVAQATQFGENLVHWAEFSEPALGIAASLASDTSSSCSGNYT